MHVLILLLCASLSFAASTIKSPAIIKSQSIDYPDDRIINGTAANPAQFPFQAAIYFGKSTGIYFCSGTLISDTWILTTAHCAIEATYFIIQLGGIYLAGTEEGRVTVTTTTAIIHPEYNDWLNNDVALIKLNEAVAFTDRIQPVRLPERGEVMKEDTRVRVSGWGSTSDNTTVISDRLIWTDLTTITNEECENIFGEFTLISSTLCAVGDPDHSTCDGDSGGPLVTYDDDGVATQHGVISFVHYAGCESGNPSGYVRTEQMLDWISQNTQLGV